MSERRFLAAAVQMCAGHDLQKNLDACRRLVAEAAERGATLVVLPENFAFLGRAETDKLAVAEAVAAPPADPDQPAGPIVATLKEMARRHGVWLIGGGMPEAIPPDTPGASAGDAAGKTYNTCVVVAPDGALAARYRKIHLFDIDIPGRASLCESRTTAAGREPRVCETPFGRVGLSICYDLRFPELYRALVRGLGAEIVVVPAAFTAHTGAAHWHTLLRCRAIENQCYVIAPAQAGRHNDKRASYGHSLIIDPWGTIAAEIEPDDELEAVAVAEIDRDHLDHTRRQMPCLEHAVLLR